MNNYSFVNKQYNNRNNSTLGNQISLTPINNDKSYKGLLKLGKEEYP